MKETVTKLKCDHVQKMQDALFRKMSADQRMELGVGLWRLGRELSPDKTRYGTDRSATTSHRHRSDS